MRRRLTLLVTAVLVPGAALVPGVARADRIAFACGAQICAVAPDGSARETLLDGATGAGRDRYGSPSLSADGARLAYTYRNQAYVKVLSGGALAGPELAEGYALLTRMRPDGGAVALGEFGTGRVCVYAADLTGRNCVGTAGSFGFAANGDVLADTTLPPDYRSAICRLPLAPDDGISGCHGTVLQDATANLADATTSPDGTLIAVTRSDTRGGRGRIAIFDAASGALLREVSSGPDAFPAWSPDSRSVAFDRDGQGVWVASATGVPGGERQVAPDGAAPTWGAGGPAATGGAPGGSTGGSTGGPTATAGGTTGGGTGGTTGGAAAGGPRTCRVPRLVGLTTAGARRRLSAAHCAPPKVTYRRAKRARRGRVLLQSPAAGTTITRARRTALTVGRA